MKRKELVLVGGGHAHLTILDNLLKFTGKNIKVTVIAPSYYHYYSGMGPGMLGGTYRPEEIRFATAKVVQKQGGVFIRDEVIRIDAGAKKVFTASGHGFSYDVVSFNTGSYVPLPDNLKGRDNVYPVKPIERLAEAAGKLKQLFAKSKITVGIVGGGPSSAEIAGNIWQLAKKTGRYRPEIIIFAGSGFMARFPEKVRQKVRLYLVKRGITIDETGYVKRITDQCVTLETGQEYNTDFIFMALGVKPSGIFEASQLPVGPDKGLLVNTYLQSVQHPEIFGGGDCIRFQDRPLDKVGVYAVRQNPVLLYNIMAQLEGRPLQAFNPGPDYLMVFNLGGGIGVLKKRGLVFGGRTAFFIKNRIDKKFIKKFQAIEQTR